MLRNSEFRSNELDSNSCYIQFLRQPHVDQSLTLIKKVHSKPTHFQFLREPCGNQRLTPQNSSLLYARLLITQSDGVTFVSASSRVISSDIRILRLPQVFHTTKRTYLFPNWIHDSVHYFLLLKYFNAYFFSF